MAAYAHLMNALGQNAVLFNENLTAWQNLQIKTGFQSGTDAMIGGVISGGESLMAAGASGVTAFRMGGLMRDQTANFNTHFGEANLENDVPNRGIANVNEGLGQAADPANGFMEDEHADFVEGDAVVAHEANGGREPVAPPQQPPVEPHQDPELHLREKKQNDIAYNARHDELQNEFGKLRAFNDAITNFAKFLGQASGGVFQMDQKQSDTVNAIASQNVGNMSQAIQALVSLGGEATASVRELRGATSAVSSRV